MRILLSLSLVLFTLLDNCRAEVLIVADEFPAMEVLRQRLQSEEGRSSRLIEQTALPTKLASFEAVVVYIHKDLNDSAEHAFIEYARDGGRLVLLHHSISSGKRKNQDWFKFLGVELPQVDVEQGGYKWIEGVTVQWVKLADHFLTTNRVEFPDRTMFHPAGGSARSLPAFTLHDTEVYLNHQLKGDHSLLLGVSYTDAKSSKLWTQETAGWYRKAGHGWVLYFMPGHTLHDFENASYGRIVLNAITAPVQVFK